MKFSLTYVRDEGI